MTVSPRFPGTAFAENVRTKPMADRSGSGTGQAASGALHGASAGSVTALPAARPDLLKRLEREILAACLAGMSLMLFGLGYPLAAAADNGTRAAPVHFFYTPQWYEQRRLEAQTQPGAAPWLPPNRIGASAVGFASTANMTYHGGSVMQTVTAYAIYWAPPPHSIPNTYQTLLNRWFTDVGGSSLYNIVTQYYEGSPPVHIQNVAAFGNAWVDTANPYPHAGTRTDPLLDADIQAEVTRAIAANGWPNGGLNVAFFVFTAKGVESCADPTDCTIGTTHPVYCAYHAGFFSGASDILIYANMPYDGTWSSGFPFTCGTASPSPNNNPDADIEISTTSHEEFEAVTDPVGDAWYDSGGSSGEIGDKCGFRFGNVAADGGNVTLNGNRYLVQQEWSNAAFNGTAYSGCALAYGTSAPTATASTTQPPAPATATPTRTSTATTSATPSATNTATSTATRTPTATRTLTASRTSTPTPTATMTPTLAPSNTPVPSATATTSPSPTATPVIGLSGHITYYGNAAQAVSAAVVQLQDLSAGSVSALTTSDVNGQFSFAGLGPGDWQLQPQKTGDMGTAVDVVDAIAILESTSGLQTLTAAQLIACDLNGDASVDIIDAVLILQYTVGLITRFPVAQACNSDWAFIPNPAPVPNQHVTVPQLGGTCSPGAIAFQPLVAPASNQDFTAALFGDCTGNWQPAPAAANSTAASGQVHLGRYRRERGRRIAVPLSVERPEGFRGLTANVRYDYTRLRIAGVRAVGSGRHALSAVNTHVRGAVALALASAQPLAEGMVFILEFETTTAGQPRSSALGIQQALVQP